MPKKVIFNRSDKSVEKARIYSRRKSAAIRYIYNRLIKEDRALFDRLLYEFNETQDKPFLVRIQPQKEYC